MDIDERLDILKKKHKDGEIDSLEYQAEAAQVAGLKIDSMAKEIYKEIEDDVMCVPELVNQMWNTIDAWEAGQKTFKDFKPVHDQLKAQKIFAILSMAALRTWLIHKNSERHDSEK